MGRRGHYNRDVDSAQAIGERPVDDLFRDELPVGDDDVCAVRASDHARAHTNTQNTPGNVIQLNDIAELYWTFEQENEPRYKIADDVLHAESETNTESTRQDGELRHVDAKRSQGDHEAAEKNRVGQHGGIGMAKPAFDVKLG